VIEVENLSNGGGSQTYFQMVYRSGGSNQTASNYDSQMFGSGPAANTTSNLFSNNTSGTFFGYANAGAQMFPNYSGYLSMRIYHQKTGFPTYTTGFSTTATGTPHLLYTTAVGYDAGIGSIGGIQIKNPNGFNFNAGAKLKLYGVKES
jgi:hypothetical protein